MREVAAVAIAVLALAMGQVAAAATNGQGPFPPVVPLPNGFQPEGIAVGNGTEFFVGSLAEGAIFKGDLRTGEGDILVPPQAGRVAVGVDFDSRTGYLFVAGGPTGSAYVHDTSTGETVGVFQLTTPPSTFVNDVVVTRTAAYFTDSFRHVLYRLPLSANGALPSPDAVEELPLGGDFVPVAGFNANGIDATPDGKTLVLVNSSQGTLYTVDPATGSASLIDLGGDNVASGDGILLDGKTLYVVQNFLDRIAVVELDSKLESGSVVRHITDPDFRIPTTIAESGNSLYAVNARFDVPPSPDTEYEVVQIPKD